MRTDASHEETLSSSMGTGPVMSELFVDHKGGLDQRWCGEGMLLLRWEEGDFKDMLERTKGFTFHWFLDVS